MYKYIIGSIVALSIGCGGLPKPPQPPNPPTPSTINFDTVICNDTPVQNHCNNPIAGATVKVNTAPNTFITQVSNADGYNLWTVPASLVDSYIVITADGYDPLTVSVHPPDMQGPLHNIFTLNSTLPQPINFNSLVLEPDDQFPCHHNQIVAIPTGQDRRFWRGDTWGVTVPGLPFVNGGSSKHPERVLTWFFDRWSADWQNKILYAYRQRGYTHFVLSWPDSRSGNGQSINQFVSTAQLVHKAIPYTVVFLTSKVYDPANATGQDRLNSVSPVVDALLAGGFDNTSLILVAGWELDTFNEGQKLEDFINLLHAKYPSLDIYAHFTTYKTSWQPDGQPRAQFWTSTQGALTGLLYQANQNDSCGLMQAHYNDAMVPAAGLTQVGALLVPFELQASNSFDGDHPNEDDANARGWEMMNTPGALLSSGFGEGARYPSGAPTLSRYQQ